MRHRLHKCFQIITDSNNNENVNVDRFISGTQRVFDLSGQSWRGGYPQKLRTTPLLVTVKFGLGSDSTPTER